MNSITRSPHVLYIPYVGPC